MEFSNIFKQYRSYISYAFFGVCTTLVNILTYGLLYYKLGINNSFSVIIAWGLAILFAFFTNKFFVFTSKSIKRMNKELVYFIFFRIITGIIDFLIMYVLVDCLNFLPLLWKVLSNIIVIILNFLFSNFFVFKGNNYDTYH